MAKKSFKPVGSKKSKEAKKKSILYPNRLPSYGESVVELIQGSGVFLLDSKKNKYIDANSGLWNVSLGYGNREIINAINSQVNKLPFINLFDFTNPVVKALAKKLLEFSSFKFERVLFTSSGSESIEAAIKATRKFHKITNNSQKYVFASFSLSYHGTTYAAMSASGIDNSISVDYEPKVPGFITLPEPKCVCCPGQKMSKACIQSVRNSLSLFFSEHKSSLAGVIVEPVLGSGGIIVLGREYLQHLEKLCNENNVLLIFDEVATGFGRVGANFAFQKFKVTPDILCTGKGINSGYLPLGATLFSRNIIEAFQSKNTFLEHFSTQNGNPIACASAIATLKFLEKNNLIAHVENQGKKLIKTLSIGLKKHPHIFEIRGVGLMIGIELVYEKKNRFSYGAQGVLNIQRSLMKKGLIVYPFFSDKMSGIGLFPPFIINDKEIKIISDIIIEFFNESIGKKAKHEGEKNGKLLRYLSKVT
jgi:adenosylmethionine-8-amino-7-oxononanoate aminotransferase